MLRLAGHPLSRVGSQVPCIVLWATIIASDAGFGHHFSHRLLIDLFHPLVRGLGGYAASHAQGTGTARAFRAILAGRPWVVVTVPTLVPRARWLGWARE
jgi:hypothetical protein